MTNYESIINMNVEDLAKQFVVSFTFMCGHRAQTIYRAVHTGEDFDYENEAIEAEICYMKSKSDMSDWNYNMDECPLDTRVMLLSSDDSFFIPQMKFVGTLTDNGRFITKGECFRGDPDCFYRCKIVAWKKYEV